MMKSPVAIIPPPMRNGQKAKIQTVPAWVSRSSGLLIAIMKRPKIKPTNPKKITPQPNKYRVTFVC